MRLSGEGSAGAGGRPAPGVGLRTASWWGTAIFTVTAASAASAPGLGAGSAMRRVLDAVAFAVAVSLFLAGCMLFFAAYLRGVARSRTEQVAVTTLFFLAGSVVPAVRWSLFGSLAVEVAVAVATALARPYTSLAAGALVPMYGLGLCGLWSARHGIFPPRDPGSERRPPRRSDAPPAPDGDRPPSGRAGGDAGSVGGS